MYLINWFEKALIISAQHFGPNPSNFRLGFGSAELLWCRKPLKVVWALDLLNSTFFYDLNINIFKAVFPYPDQNSAFNRSKKIFYILYELFFNEVCPGPCLPEISSMWRAARKEKEREKKKVKKQEIVRTCEANHPVIYQRYSICHLFSRHKSLFIRVMCHFSAL